MSGDSRDERYRRAVARHGDAIARLARAMEADPQRRDELVQDIHLQLWRSFSGFDGRCSERTWVFRVAHNVAASHVASERRAVVTVPEQDVPEAVPMADVVERRNALEVVRGLVRGLPLLDRQVTLLFLEGMSPAEIAEVMGASPNAVSIRLHRVKTLLASRLAGGTP